MYYKAKDTAFSRSADKIRAKTGNSEAIQWDEDAGFENAIDAIQTGGGSATLITKNIDANGTYNASSDNADGYSSVYVAVPGPPLIRGSFIGQASEKGSAITINLPYTGNGYPIAGMIYPAVGGYKSGGDLASLAQKGAMIMVQFVKTDFSLTPDYSANAELNQMEMLAYFKYSDSDATSISDGRARGKRNYWNTNASETYGDCIRLRSDTSMSVFIANASFGFVAEVEYKYEIFYSE